jgi:hypothetical protein
VRSDAGSGAGHGVPQAVCRQAELVLCDIQLHSTGCYVGTYSGNSKYQKKTQTFYSVKIECSKGTIPLSVGVVID